MKRGGRVQTALLFSFLACFAFPQVLDAQLSPGPLSAAHSGLEGIQNCTRCHTLGEKLSDQKCLDCHKEISTRITNGKGYHASSAVKGKSCSSCHGEHNGRNARLIRLDTANFDHASTGYALVGAHKSQSCNSCHRSRFISDKSLKTGRNTWLGLDEGCLSCHEDYHRQTLPGGCLSCHNSDAFAPATGFNHSSSRFPLVGMHTKVSCIKCHKKSVVDGKTFQEFRGVGFANCTACHTDPHSNRYGQNCRQCHSEVSFKAVSAGAVKAGFDHSTTDFPLEGRHRSLQCNSCHKGSTMTRLNHARCTDCHSDYHRGQFTRNGSKADCIECHNTSGFEKSSFTMEKHNAGNFPLKGAHEATPCMDCHRKADRWSFRNVGIRCADCHVNIHEGYIDQKFMGGGNCRSCHGENAWSSVTFDHTSTGFALTGAHVNAGCRECHFTGTLTGKPAQRFSGLGKSCTSCHADNHRGQFVKNGVTACTDCHTTQNWKASLFDHGRTAFALDGRHAAVPCSGCHKPQKEGSAYYTRYKIEDTRCEYCH